MMISNAGRMMVLILGLAAIPAFASRTHRATVPNHTHASLKRILSRRHLAHGRHAAPKLVGQRQIAPERATEIQAALIRQKYMTGSPTGQWDADTESAMQRFQADHGWQTKLTPDSRALITLGLGPTQNGASNPSLLNAQAANTSSAPASDGDTLASVHAVRQ